MHLMLTLTLHEMQVIHSYMFTLNSFLLIWIIVELFKEELVSLGLGLTLSQSVIFDIIKSTLIAIYRVTILLPN